jgi:uncharacterized repeat protein (TIGR01451 family)
MRKINRPVTSVFSFALLLGPHLSAQAGSNFGAVPLYFEENKGQTGVQAKYLARSPSLVGFVLQDGWTLSLHGQPVSMHIAKASAKAILLPENSVEGITNYYLGSRAITSLPHYSSVRAKNIRPGIDIVYHGNERDLEYDLVIRPGADVDALRLRFDGSQPTLADNGDIVLKTSAGEVRQHKPRVWQGTTEVGCRYIVKGSGEVGFVLSDYDRSAELTVDPIISYSTYLSGTNTDTPASIAVDGSGYAYVTGTTSSSDFPITSGTYQGNTDVFVTKLNPTGTGLVFSTFIGGTSLDTSRGIAIDNAGNAYVTGFTLSTNFPVTLNQLTPGQHAFALKLGNSGNIVYSTALAGNGVDIGLAIAVDPSGSAYVAGNTFSTNFPTTPGSYMTTLGGFNDAFVAKLSSTGQISYATYLGGTFSDSATAIAVDASGNAFVGGTTQSSNFPTTPGAFATSAGGQNAFIVKLNPTGSALIYSTFLGGSNPDSLSGLALDSAGNCYVTGSTDSPDFPITPGAFLTTKPPGPFTTAFVAKLSATGASLVYSTFLGGFGNEAGVAIAVDSTNAAYVVGSSQSSDFPTTPGALKAVGSPISNSCCDFDMFLVRVTADGSALSYSTRLGSSTSESVNAIALDAFGGAYVVGVSQSLSYPTTSGAFQTSNPKGPGNQSTVVTKIDFSVATLCNPSISPNSQNLPGRGGAISFNLTLSPGCPWEAVPSSTLVLNNPKSGVVSTSPILLTGTVLQNPSASFGIIQTVQIGTASYTVNQDAGSCQDSVISPLSVTFDSSGGIRILNLTLPLSCPWTAVSGAPWLSVSGKTSGMGPASITLFTASDIFSPRSTTLIIAGKSITVTQSGSTCTATASILISSPSSQGGDGVAQVFTNSAACTWNAYSNAAWIQLNASTTPGQGSGFVPFVLASNPLNVTRSGQIVIADITLSITQDAGPVGIVSGYSLSTVAGGGSPPNLGDGGPALGARLSFPAGLAFDAVTSNLYVVDSTSRVRVITPDGNINTFAGGGAGTGENISATSAMLSSVSAVAVDSSSAVYVNDLNSRVRKISQGNIVTFAGNTSAGFGGDGGPAANALLNSPSGIAVDLTGGIYISDSRNNRVRRVNGGTISTVAGSENNVLGDNGPATSASLNFPVGVGLDSGANLLIADSSNSRVRRVSQGNITTIAGGGTGGDGGPATSAALSNPTTITIDAFGDIIFYENSSGRIRKVSADGTISTIQFPDDARGLAADKLGNIYFSDTSTELVKKLTPLPSFCNYLVSTPLQIAQAGGSLQIAVISSAGCRWSALLLPSWLTPNGATVGIGTGTITLTALPNAGTTPRSVTFAIAGMPVSVTQSIVDPSPSLSILKTHVGNFSAGQHNAAYSITVSNAATAGPTTGLVTVTDLLPSGLTLVGMAGLGWTCQNASCTRSDVLNGGGAYPILSAIVIVAVNATSPQVNQVNVSGGGSAPATALDSTVITEPTFSVNRGILNFEQSFTGLTTSPQTVTVSFSGEGGVPWTATSNQSRIVVSHGSGAGNGSFQVSVNNDPYTLLHVDGIITVTAPGATGSPKQIPAHFIVSGIGFPIGSFDTPADNTTGVAGAIPVTGWALDPIEVSKVDIWREPVGGEPTGTLIYIGDAVFVDGARPDVEAVRQFYPFSYRAGWGYQLLTNFLPQGNGTFKLHAIAHSSTGPSLDLGTKTIVVDNLHAAKPFGTLDTPGQGGTASGNAFVNFGWVLTQNPNKIAVDGSTISVVIDGQVVGHPTYNQFRSDIASLFPGYVNSGGAVGFFYIDTTTLSSGVHTISWNVFDNAGHGDGIGSRYFNVFNSGGGSVAKLEEMGNPLANGRASETSLEIDQVGLVELPVGAVSGYQLVNGERRPLPIGSSFKHGVFYWQPGPGFLGQFQLVLEQKDGKQMPVTIIIRKKAF